MVELDISVEDDAAAVDDFGTSSWVEDEACSWDDDSGTAEVAPSEDDSSSDEKTLVFAEDATVDDVSFLFVDSTMDDEVLVVVCPADDTGVIEASVDDDDDDDDDDDLADAS